MSRAVRHLVDISPDLIDRNPEANGGRLLFDGTCGLCRTRWRPWLGPGRWAIDHDHRGTWTAHLLRLQVPEREAIAR